MVTKAHHSQRGKEHQTKQW